MGSKAEIIPGIKGLIRAEEEVRSGKPIVNVIPILTARVRRNGSGLIIKKETDLAELAGIPDTQLARLPADFHSALDRGATLIIDLGGNVILHRNSNEKK